MRFFDRATLRYGLILAADLSTKVAGLLMTVIIVRALGKADFGTYRFSLQLTAYALLVGNLGLDIYAKKHASKDLALIGSLATTLTLMRLALGAITFGLLILVAWYVPVLRVDFWIIAILGLSLFTQALTLNWVPSAIQHAPSMAVFNAAIPAVNLVTVIAAVALSNRLWTVAAAKVVAELIVAGVLAWWVVRYVSRPHKPLPWARCKDVFAQALPIGGSAILRNLGLGSDLVILGLLANRGLYSLTKDDVGLYAAATTIYLLAVSTGGAYFGLLYPRLAALGDQSDILRRETNAALWRIFGWSVVGLTAGTFLAKWILWLLMGAKMVPAAASLQILLWSALGFHLGSTYNWVLVVRHRQQLAMWITAASTVVHVGAKVALIPRWGIDGAAVGMLLGELTFTVLGFLATRHFLSERERPLGPLARPAARTD